MYSFQFQQKTSEIIYIEIYDVLPLSKKVWNNVLQVCKIFGPKLRSCNFFWQISSLSVKKQVFRIQKTPYLWVVRKGGIVSPLQLVAQSDKKEIGTEQIRKVVSEDFP